MGLCKRRAIRIRTDEHGRSRLKVSSENINVRDRVGSQIGSHAGESHKPAIGTDDGTIAVASQCRISVKPGTNEGGLAGP